MEFDAVFGTRYHTIAHQLRQRILDGTWPAGSQLRSEHELSVEYRCGRDTLRDALHVLRAEGLIIKQRGRRAVVATEPDRELVLLLAGSTVSARMPLGTEFAVLHCRAETPLLVVTPPGDATVLHPADRVLLTVAR